MNTFEQMIERGHERVCYHQDPGTGLRAIIAIHSTKLGNGLWVGPGDGTTPRKRTRCTT